jgi:hypothetical protein
LEQAKLRLEMSLEQQRKENRRELAQRDEELEDVRCNAQKKVKGKHISMLLNQKNYFKSLMCSSEA